MALDFSFSMRHSTPLARVFVAVLGVFCFCAPVAYFTWWGLGGGREWEVEREMRAWLRFDPEAAAREAIERGDFRLYTTGDLFDDVVPGTGGRRRDYGETFGYRGFRTLAGGKLTPERQQLADEAMRRAAVFNRLVYAAANRTNPTWREEWRRRQANGLP